MVKVSIIVPVYNSSRYLKKCFDSICNQVLEDIEIIILNDASTDNSLDIIRNYEKLDSRIKVVNMKENVGPGALRNIGIDLADGDYIGFVDSDDYIEPTMYLELYNKTLQNDVDIALCGFIQELYGIDYRKMLFGVNRNSTNEFIIEPKKETDFLCEQIVSCWNKLYKHDFIEKFRFPEQLKFEDYPMVVNMLGSSERIFSMEKGLYHYRIRPNSLTTIDNNIFNPNTLDIFACNDLIKEYYTENGLLTIFEESLNKLFLNHSVSKLIPMLSVSMPFSKKKQLINYYANLLDLEFGNWQEDEYFLFLKQHSIRLRPYMYFLNKFFLDDSLRGEISSEKIKQKIIELCNEQK